MSLQVPSEPCQSFAGSDCSATDPCRTLCCASGTGSSTGCSTPVAPRSVSIESEPSINPAGVEAAAAVVDGPWDASVAVRPAQPSPRSMPTAQGGPLLGAGPVGKEQRRAAPALASAAEHGLHSASELDPAPPGGSPATSEGATDKDLRPQSGVPASDEHPRAQLSVSLPAVGLVFYSLPRNESWLASLALAPPLAAVVEQLAGRDLIGAQLGLLDGARCAAGSLSCALQIPLWKGEPESTRPLAALATMRCSPGSAALCRHMVLERPYPAAKGGDIAWRACIEKLEAAAGKLATARGVLQHMPASDGPVSLVEEPQGGQSRMQARPVPATLHVPDYEFFRSRPKFLS